MALFPEDQVVDVATPDGRTLRLPQNVLSMLQMPPPAAAAPASMPLPPTTNTVPEAPVDSVTGGALPTEEDQLAPAGPYTAPTTPPVSDSPGTEGQVVATVDNSEPAVAKTNKAYAKQQKAAAAAASSPVAQVNRAAGVQNQALANEAEATLNAADVDAAGQMMMNDAYKTRNAEILKHENARAQALQAQQLAEQQKAAEIGKQREKIANTKIDRKADHPILAAISIALFELGSAMKGQEIGRGVEMLYKAIDRKVAAQMADLDQMGKIYGFQKEELDMLKDSGKRKLEFHNMMIAGETDKAIRQIEEMTARTNSEKLKANAKIIVAQLQQRGAAASMDALRWGLDYDQKDKHQKAQLGLGYANLHESRRATDLNAQLRREDMYLDYQKSLAASKAKGDELEMKHKLELIKDNETRGVGNIAEGGKPLLSQKGLDMLAQADKHLADAKTLRELDAKSPDPEARKRAEARAAALEEKASILRGDAQIYGQFRARSTEEAREIGKKYSAAQSAMTLVDEIMGLYDKNGKAYIHTDEGRAAVQTKMSQLNVALKDAWQAGAWDKGLATLMANTTGGDPTKGTDVQNMINMITGGVAGTDPEAFKGRLNSIAGGLEDDVYNTLRAAKWDVTDKQKLFGRRQQPENTPERQATKRVQQDKTPGETAEGLRDAGPLSVVTDRFRFVSREDKARAAEESGSLTYPGFSKAQGEEMGKLLKAHEGGNEKASQALLAQALDSSRPELQKQTMFLLQDKAPALYNTARAQIQTGPLAEQLDYSEKNQLAVSDTPIDILSMQAMMPGDTEAFKELARRAESDKKAGKILLDVIKARQSRKDPLGISTGGK